MTLDRQIAEALRAAQVPRSEPAMQRAITRAISNAGSARAAGATAGGSSARRLAIAGFVIVALTGLSFTPPGRAVAGGIADLVGIGDSPTVEHPSLTGTPTVIGTGSSLDGVEFEISAYQAERHGIPGTCISLDWPEKASPRGGEICIAALPSDALPKPVLTDPQGQLGPRVGLVLNGVLGGGIARLDVTYRTPSGQLRRVPVTLARITPDLTAQAHTSVDAGYFVALIPEKLVRGQGSAAPVARTLELKGFAKDGHQVAALDFGNDLSHDLRHEQSVNLKVQQAQDAVASNPYPTFTAKDCPTIAAALKRIGRPASSFTWQGPTCPTAQDFGDFLGPGSTLKSVVISP